MKKKHIVYLLENYVGDDYLFGKKPIWPYTYLSFLNIEYYVDYFLMFAIPILNIMANSMH